MLLHDAHGERRPQGRRVPAADDARPRGRAGGHRPRHVLLGAVGGPQAEAGRTKNMNECQL